MGLVTGFAGSYTGTGWCALLTDEVIGWRLPLCMLFKQIFKLILVHSHRVRDQWSTSAQKTLLMFQTQ